MKKITSKLSFKLFYNDKFVMLFSILVAFISWLYISSTVQESTVFTVTDIPVSLPELSSELRYYNTENLKSEVKISGNALVVTSVTAEDIYITASDTSHITNPGKYTMDLVPKKSGLKTDYSFVSSVTPSSIEVYVDGYKERNMPIIGKIDVQASSDSLYIAQPVLAQQSIKITGASSVIDSISYVNAEYKFSQPISETTIVKAQIKFYDSNGNEIKSSYIKSDITEVSTNVSVLTVKELRIAPNIINVPDYLTLDENIINVEPSTIKIAVPTSASINELVTEPIDFNQVDLENNKFNVKIDIPTGYKNIDGTETAVVSFDTSGMTSKTITMTNIQMTNKGMNQTPSVITKTLNINVIGPKEKLSKLTAANITAIVDLSEKSTLTSGIVEMPVSIILNQNYSDCWVKGSYTVNITFSPKTETSLPQSSAASSA